MNKDQKDWQNTLHEYGALFGKRSGSLIKGYYAADFF